MPVKYDLDDRFLFWLRKVTGIKIDRLYQSRGVRFCLIAIRNFSGMFS